MTPRRIALISEHASPLATLGGVDSGGQNVYVGQLARQLAALGHDVDILTRRDSARLPDVVAWSDGARVVHVPAGPAAPVRKENLLPYMGEFAAWTLRQARRRPYDVVHANFFMSAVVALELKRATGTPVVVTFHALGRVRRLHQREADAFPECRLAIEDQAVAEADRIIAECPQDRGRPPLGSTSPIPARITTIPCGFDPTEFWPIRPGIGLGLALGFDPRRAPIDPPSGPDGPPQGGG